MRSQYIIERSHILWALRSFFYRHRYIEIEPPCIVTSPGLEPQLDAMSIESPHARHALEINHKSAPRWLHTSPEYAIKRYLGNEGIGVPRVYALTPCFRDEAPSETHSPEFSLIEWYARDLSLEELMDQCEELVCELAQALAAYRDVEVDGLERLFDRPFERLSVREAFLRYANIDLEACPQTKELREAALRSGVRESALEGTWDELYFQVFMDRIEPHLGQERPTFLYDFPASQAALARLSPEDPRWARRFELFASGLELANAFDELTDPLEQRARFESDLEERVVRGSSTPPIDEALLRSLPQLGHCVGIALGFDRLVMLLCGARSIEEVRLQAWGDS